MGIHKERGEAVGLASFGGVGTNFDSIMGEVTAGGEVTDLVAAGGEVVEASLGDGGHCIKKGFQYCRVIGGWKTRAVSRFDCTITFTDPDNRRLP